MKGKKGRVVAKSTQAALARALHANPQGGGLDCIEDQLKEVSRLSGTFLAELAESQIPLTETIKEVHSTLEGSGASEEANWRTASESYEEMAETAERQGQMLLQISQLLGPVIVARRREEALQLRSQRSAMLNSISGALPMWLGTGHLPPLVGAVPHAPEHVVPNGDQVAARISKKSLPDVWILATVVNYVPSKRAYTVEDIMDDSATRSDVGGTTGTSQTHVLSHKAVVPLAKWLPLPHRTDAFHPVQSHRVALYPQTTCFYQCVVRAQPTKDRQEYVVRFSDDEDVDGSTPDRCVSQRFVVNVPVRKTPLKVPKVKE